MVIRLALFVIFYFKDNYHSGFQKYVPIDLVNYAKVIASEAKQSDPPSGSSRVNRGIPRLGSGRCFASDCFVVT